MSRTQTRALSPVLAIASLAGFTGDGMSGSSAAFASRAAVFAIVFVAVARVFPGWAAQRPEGVVAAPSPEVALPEEH